MFKFLLTFFMDIISPVISSTQIACDVRHVCTTSNSLIFTVYRKKSISFYKEFFLQTMPFIRKNKGGISHLNQT